MLVPMAKVRVIGHRRQLDDVLAFLQEQRALHLIDVTDDSQVRLPPLRVDADQMRELEELRYLKARLDAIASLAPGSRSAVPHQAERHEAGSLLVETALGPITPDEVAALRSELDIEAPRLESIIHHLDALVDEQAILPRYVTSLRRLLPLVPQLNDFAGYDMTVLLIDSRYTGVLGDLNASLADVLGANYEIISDRVDSETLGAVLVFPRARTADVRSLLGHEQLTQVRLPQQFQGMPFQQAIAAMERRMAALPGEIEAAQDDIDVFVRSHSTWAVRHKQLGNRLDQLAAVHHLGATLHTFVMSGWLPETELESIQSRLADTVGSEVLIETVPTRPDDAPPVLMHNPPPARPFEFLVNLLGMPRYGTIDPTRLMALFLPFFFGIMLGDVGYGTLLLVISFVVFRRFRDRSPVVRDLSLVLMMSASWAIVWGFIYGEFFGDLGDRLFGMQPLWIDREEAIEPLLLFALAVGAAHIVLGLVLGGVQAVRSREPRLFTERAAMLLALVGLFVIVGSAVQWLPSEAMAPAVASVIVGLAVLMALGGAMGIFMGPLELLGTVGNVLSYLRLAAIGLASVYLARVANELGAAAPLLIGIIVAALFHALNLALGAFSPTIQSLRLHYVEFFSKFHEPGGEPYRAFGAPDPGKESVVS